MAGFGGLEVSFRLVRAEEEMIDRQVASGPFATSDKGAADLAAFSRGDGFRRAGCVSIIVIVICYRLPRWNVVVKGLRVHGLHRSEPQIPITIT